VQAPAADPIQLSVSSNRKRNRVDLAWSGATTSKVDIYRDGVFTIRTRNDGSWADRNVSKGNTYGYLVCASGSVSACSNPAVIDL